MEESTNRKWPVEIGTPCIVWSEAKSVQSKGTKSSKQTSDERKAGKKKREAGSRKRKGRERHASIVEPNKGKSGGQVPDRK